ncbi:MAG: nickel pincer cofactor biosynthesis protein LarB [Acidaminobacteraceae bacterium]
MDSNNLHELLTSLKEGKTSVDEVMNSIKSLEYTDLNYAKIDNHRELRNGFPEVIYCEGKTEDQLIGIINAMNEKGSNILGTRLSKDVYNNIKDKITKSTYHESSRLICIVNHELKKSIAKVLIATGGTSDIPVAEEAAITAEMLGTSVLRLYDVGVAGIHRLLNNRKYLEEASVVITVAGMEGALASVVGGLVDVPVIAVPTSVGYGANFSGLAPLFYMLNTCASGVGVVNIDNGFGAGHLASTIIRQIEETRDEK